MDEEKGMYERYAALFALRNHGGDEAISSIVDSLSASSALLRHEVFWFPFQLLLQWENSALWIYTLSICLYFILCYYPQCIIILQSLLYYQSGAVPTCWGSFILLENFFKKKIRGRLVIQKDFDVGFDISYLIELLENSILISSWIKN